MAGPLRRRKGFFVRWVWCYITGQGIKRPEIGEVFRVGYASVRQERRRLSDRVSDDRNTQDLFKGLLEKCTD
jgi:hypothetical protein